MATTTIPGADRPHDIDQSGSDAMHDLNCQRLRILRCTAHAMANSPGGLRFKAGTRPWLDGLSAGVKVFPSRMSLSPNARIRPIAA